MNRKPPFGRRGMGDSPSISSGLNLSQVNPQDAQAVISEAQVAVERLTAHRADLRREERSLQAREKALSSQPQARGGLALAAHMANILPQGLMPGNVGGYNQVQWPFWFSLNFDFGADPTLNSNTTQTQRFQVTQEAAFLLLAINRSHYSDSTSGAKGPYQVTIRDQQSTRQFNDRPIPLQAFGIKSDPTRLPTALLFMPNAFVEVTMNTWLPPGLDQATTGSSFTQLNFFGYRIRVEDTEKVLSSIFT